MTIANVRLKIFAALVCLVMPVTLFACSGGGDDPSRLEGLELAQDKENVSGYFIVLPPDSGSAVAQSAERLRAEIAQRTGVSCDVYYGNQSIPYVEGSITVLVGDTGHSQSTRYIHSLRRDDYVFRAQEELIVLGGRSDASNVAAIDRFINEVLLYRDGKRIADVDDGFDHYAEYEIGTLNVCGVRLGGYDIVCFSERGSAEARLVSELRERIADRCGEYPNLRYGDSHTENVREILVMTDPSFSNAATVSYDGEDVVIRANGEYGLSVGIKKLYADMFSSVSEGVASFDMAVGATEIYAQSVPSVTVSTLTTDIPKNTALADKALQLAENIKQSEADLLYLAGVDSEVWSIVKNNVGSSHKTLSLALGSESCVAFVYDDTRLTYNGELSDMKNSGGVFSGELCFDVEGERIKIGFMLGATSDVGEQEISSLVASMTDGSAYSAAVIAFTDADAYDLNISGTDTVHNAVLAVNTNQQRICVLAPSEHFEPSSAITKTESCFGSVTAELKASACKNIFGS